MNGFELFFLVFTANLLALIIFWLMQDIVNKRLSLSTLFLFIKDTRFYYLTFVHERAYAELLKGTDRTEIIRILQDKPFAFLLDSNEKEKYADAQSFILSVLKDENILNTYLIQKEFNQTIYREVLAALNESSKKKDLFDRFRLILVDTSNTGIEKAERVFTTWLSKPFPIQYEFNYSINKSKNQVMLFEAGKTHLFKMGITQKDFVACLKALKILNNDIEIVSAPAMSQVSLNNYELTTSEKLLDTMP